MLTDVKDCSPSSRSLKLSRRRTVAGALGASLWVSGCRASLRTRPPYPQGSAPSPAQLHAALTPQVQALQIRKAKVRDELTPSARFAALIQAPGRIHGSLFLKGQEIMSLIANEEGYGLRYNFDRGIRPGYYHGPKDRCAVQTFLGAPIEIDDLISILLGGGPSSFKADAVLSQSWDPEVGGERVVFFDRRRRRSLVAHFLWRNESWVLYAATGYRYQGDRAIWEWSVRHLDFGRVSDAPNLPSRIKIGRIEGGMKRYLELSIQDATTQVLIPSEPSEDQDQWEDDDDWEEADGSDSTPDSTTPESKPESETGSATASDSEKAQSKPKASIPAVFIPNPAGLVDRGPLCRGPRR